MNLRGVDLSNHQAHPDTYRGLTWYRDAAFVIVQAINPPAGFPGADVGGYTAAQLRAAREDGKYIGIYVWLWNTLADTKADVAARLALVPEDLELDMRPWLDVEDITANTGPSRQQDVLDALEVMDAWAAAHGLPPTGIYSGDWYLRDYMAGWFPKDRMYWLADYGTPPHVFPMRPIHQYTSTPVDTNVMLETELVDRPAVDPRNTRIDQLLSTIGVMGGDVADSLENTGAVLHKQAAAKRMNKAQIGGSANNIDSVVKELRRLRAEVG